MRIALASDGQELTSKLNPRLGRARYIIIVDTIKKDFVVIDNEEISDLSGGAGVKAAEAIVEQKVDFVVSQNFGPNALRVFKASDVKAAVISGGTVEEAIEDIKRGQYNLI